jgi:hypothetical protein
LPVNRAVALSDRMSPFLKASSPAVNQK